MYWWSCARNDSLLIQEQQKEKLRVKHERWEGIDIQELQKLCFSIIITIIQNCEKPYAKIPLSVKSYIMPHSSLFPLLRTHCFQLREPTLLIFSQSKSVSSRWFCLDGHIDIVSLLFSSGNWSPGDVLCTFPDNIWNAVFFSLSLMFFINHCQWQWWSPELFTCLTSSAVSCCSVWTQLKLLFSSSRWQTLKLPLALLQHSLLSVAFTDIDNYICLNAVQICQLL